MAWNVWDQLNENTAAAVADDTPKACFRTKNISVDRIYSNTGNFYSMPDIDKLAQNIYTNGLMQNLEVAYEPCEKGDYRIIAGERRWRALKMLIEQGQKKDFEKVTCQIVTPASEEEEQLRLISANAYRIKTVADVLEEEERLKKILQTMKEKGLTIKGQNPNGGRLRDVIAKIMNLPPTKIAQIEVINKHLLPEFTQELKEGRLTFTAAYEISGMAEEAQKEILQRYQENGLTFKEVREIKKEQEEKKAAEQIPGQMSFVKESEEKRDIPLDKTDMISKGNDPEEWKDAHPESIISQCYSCYYYSTCNVKTGTCRNCDKYKNKAETEKTDEQRYDEEQAAIDRETAKKLRERTDEEKMQQLPSEQGKKIHDVKLGATFFDDVRTGRKTFELRKNDRGYREGDTIVLHEYKDGATTGRTITKKIVYMLEDFTGLEDGYCILGLGALEKTLQLAAVGAGQDADNRILEYGA